MKTSFRVRDQEYQLTLEKSERAEDDKFQPYRATVTGQPGGSVEGKLQITDEALSKAESGGSSDEALARACGRSLAAEVLIRKLKPDFSFIVDHRWL